MENQGIKQNTIESLNQDKLEIIESTPSPDKIEKEIEIISNKKNQQEDNILSTMNGVEEIRKTLGLGPNNDSIPSVEINKNNIVKLKDKRRELEDKLSEILKHDVSEKYKNFIDQVKDSKIDWASSEELARRLKLKGLGDEDILQVKEWLINNTRDIKTVVLPINKYNELSIVLSEMTGEKIGEAEGFYSQGGRKDLPEEGKNTIFMKEKTIPSIGNIPEKKFIDEKTLSHEFGHATQDGLLETEQFSGEWNPKFKEDAPDKEYVGQIVETDTRLRSMFNNLGNTFDPKKEVFGKKQLEILRQKQSDNLLDKDTKDLLDHYDDIELVKMANRMPAI